jgi:hypothetical protein
VRFNRNGGVAPPRRPKIRKALPRVWQLNEALQELAVMVEAINRIKQKLAPGLGSRWSVKAVRFEDATRRFHATTARHYQQERKRIAGAATVTAPKTALARAERIRAKAMVGEFVELDHGPLAVVEDFGSADALDRLVDLENSEAAKDIEALINRENEASAPVRSVPDAPVRRRMALVGYYPRWDD